MAQNTIRTETVHQSICSKTPTGVIKLQLINVPPIPFFLLELMGALQIGFVFAVVLNEHNDNKYLTYFSGQKVFQTLIREAVFLTCWKPFLTTNQQRQSTE